MNSENSKISEPHRLLLNLADKMNLKTSDKYVASSNFIIHGEIWRNIKKSYKSNKFKTSARTLNKTFNLPDGSYPASDIQFFSANIP